MGLVLVFSEQNKRLQNRDDLLNFLVLAQFAFGPHFSLAQGAAFRLVQSMSDKVGLDTLFAEEVKAVLYDSWLRGGVLADRTLQKLENGSHIRDQRRVWVVAQTLHVSSVRFFGLNGSRGRVRLP